MKKTLILTLAAAAIMGIGTSPLRAETGSGSTQPVQKQMTDQRGSASENAPASPQDDNDKLISMCIIEIGTEHWEENVQDILEFIGITPQAEWEEHETEGRTSYGKTEYSSDGKYKYNVSAFPFSLRYTSVMITVFGKEKVHGDFVVPDTSNKTMAGMCFFSVFPDSDHERWDNAFWDTCNVLGIDVMESEWRTHDDAPGYSKRGFDEKGENMFTIHVVPPIDEGDLCAVAIIKWAL